MALEHTLVERTMSEVRQRIARRALAPGAKAPSIRAFATAMGVSKSTVVEAYDRLAAEGVIQPRRGSGFYVAGHTPPLALSELEPRRDRSIDPLWVSRQSLEAGPDALKPGCGWLPADWMPREALRRALRAAARADDFVLADYGPARGLPVLRRLLRARLHDEGVEAGIEQILLTGSGTEAIDLILRHGKEGEIYNVGGHNEMKNIDIVKLICRELGKPEELITYVEDRKGHDRRYAIDPSKIHRELGWLPETSFAEGIKKTINWYLNHQEWWRPIVEKEMKIKC